MSVENRKLDDSGSWKVDFKERKMNLSVQLMDNVCACGIHTSGIHTSGIHTGRV